MLSRFSWGEFGCFIAGGCVLYYLFVVARFYRKEMQDVLSGKRRPGGQPIKGQAGGEAAPGSGDGQGKLFAAGSPDQASELFKVMETVISHLKAVVSMGVAERTKAEELKDHIREVLAKYGQLKKTPYQVAINNYVVRVCASNFSLVIDEEAMERLWS